MQRVFCVLLSVVLLLSLAACGRSETSSQTTTGGVSGGSTGSTGIGNVIGDTANNAGNAVNDALNGALDMTDLPFENGASVMLNGKLYRLTGEMIRTDELGPQILSTTDKVTGVPANNGEGFGLEKETKVYQIRNNEANDAVAVEIQGMYYRANLHEEDTSGNSNGMGNTGSSSASGAMTSAASSSAKNGARNKMR